jgi:tetratricopeptide (TPR) repeat protein
MIAGGGTSNDYQTSAEKRRAQIYYMLGLISQNRSKDAVALAKKINAPDSDYIFDEAFKTMEHAGYTDALDDFLYELLSQDPTLSFWNEYVQTAAAAGKTDRMLGLVRSAAGRGDLSNTKRAAIQQILFQALLASDKTNEGVAEMRRLISAENSKETAGKYSAGQLGIMLARIGLLEGNTNWTSEGISASRKWLASPAGQNYSSGDAENVVESLSQILFELKRGPEAEALLTDALATASRSGSQTDFSWNNPSQQILAQLALLYHKAGRYDDVLNLLRQSPDWGVKDLSELFDSSPWDNDISMVWLHAGSSPMPVPYIAASALIATGQKDQARKIVSDLLLRYPGLDRGYELLLALDGTNAIPQLDELYKRDQFEERPLIWKAHLLRHQDRLEEAENVIRQAISIDPSDGEEGRGDRMRAYAELADILEARGNKKDADFYREIVRSIRMSEDADQFYQAGLLTRAIGMYEEALNHFSDAYCIQSRLAIQLSALGQNQAVEEHYRRAYELMPDSFGRVESHCFGCERAFDGERAQNIAEKVFTKFAAEHPDKPQVYYLLGYLRTEEERYNEARTNFQEAVRLDPDYLNAWVKLQEVSEQILVPTKDRDEIAFNILRLDPLQRHAHVNFETITDLPRLWNAVAIAGRKQPQFSTNLMTLAASKIALKKKENNAQNTMFMQMETELLNRYGTLSPGQAVAQTRFVQLAGQLILGEVASFDD